MLLVPAWGGAAGGITSLALTDNAADSTNGSSFTFSSAALGAAAANRYIIVGCGWRNEIATRTLSSATIGGQSATIAVQNSVAGDGNCGAAIIVALVASGTTGDVVLTLSGEVRHATIGVWRAIGLSGTAADATASDITHASGVIDLDVNTTASGLCVGYAEGGEASTTTWTGLTEDLDAVVESINSYSGASLFPTSAQTPLTVTATNADTTPASYMGVSAVWT